VLPAPSLILIPACKTGNQEETMKCENCQHDIPEDDVYIYQGRAICEDCYMKALNPVNACDPLAVRSAIGIRSSSGLKGVEGLTPLQRDIYEFIRDRGKVTALEVTASFSITLQDLNRTIATLRHCELVRGQKEGDNVYLVLF